MLTLTELQARLMKIDEISLLEVLEITSEDIAQRFLDKIDAKYDQLIEDFEEEGESLDILTIQEDYYTADDYD